MSDLQQLSGPTEVTARPLHSCLTVAVLQTETLLKAVLETYTTGLQMAAVASLHQQPPQHPAHPLLRPQRGFPALPLTQTQLLKAAANGLRVKAVTIQEAAATNSMPWQMLLPASPRTSLLLPTVGSRTPLWQARLLPLRTIRSSPSKL